jgi:hypothetical protein
MNPIRRELLNGLFVLVVASLLSVAFAAFQEEFNLQLWALILAGIALGICGYVVFEFVLSAEQRETEGLRKAEQRELEWLKRVGTPARLELDSAGVDLIVDAVKAMKQGSDLKVMVYVGAEGGSDTAISGAAREKMNAAIAEQLKRGTIREYKRLICFDYDVLANDLNLKSGILRVGEGPGTINRYTAEHCRLMMETAGCSVYVAPAVLRHFVALYGTDKVSMTLETSNQKTGARAVAGNMLFCDPPIGEIIEQFRQMEHETERRIVAVHKIVFPEDGTAPQLGNR